MLYRTFFRSFSSTVNYANTFKLRSRLSDFFKHVHPDQLQQAPVICKFYVDKCEIIKYALID